MAYKGKLIGALLGSLGGPMGSILGGLIGHLYDRAEEERQAFASRGRVSASKTGAAETVDSITSAQAHFLTCLIGLAIAVASAGRRVRVSEVNALKSFFRENLPYSEDDHRLIQRIIDETFLNRERLDIEELCLHFRGSSTVSGRRLLVRLLLKIASADDRGILDQEELLILRIARNLGVAQEDYRGIRSEFVFREAGAYQLLGLGPQASDEEVRSAYRRLASEYHPDRVSSLGEEFTRVAEEKFKLINEAYEELRRQRGF